MKPVTLPLLAAALFVAGCGGPTLSLTEQRLAFYPPRDADCSLEFEQYDPVNMSAFGAWEVLGFITFSDRGRLDPLSPEIHELIRPRACAMGGTALSIAQAMVAERDDDRTLIQFAVLRARPRRPQAEEM